ncbi:galectin-3b isoform X2 [Nelusetta ayraudi]|uniref:galectin-3b isoform X2 n=1 Tax=Nelusetta ayraudi TaxID=303726 RepID=UPI003F6EF887
MDLSDALNWPSDDNKSQGGGMWPGAASGPAWPGGQPQPQPQPSQPSWQGGGNQSQGGGMWPGAPSGPTWPGGQPQPQPSQPSSGGGMWGNTNNPSCPSAPGSNNPATAAHGNMRVPHEQRLANGIQGKVITITGTVNSNPNKLTVDLMAGRDLAFHFNPRFKDESEGKVTVMNSCLGQQWGPEERDRQHFPFTPGQPFTIKIRCTSHGFNVQVNNRDLPTFKHRTDPKSINTLRIYNDVSLSWVNVD